MLTVILSEIAAVSNEAACWIPARKLAGAAMAAASNNRLMVMPPIVMTSAVVGPLCAPSDSAASLVRAGVDGISTSTLARCSAKSLSWRHILGRGPKQESGPEDRGLLSCAGIGFKPMTFRL